MRLSLQTFGSLVQNMGAAAQAAASQLLDLGVGSTTRALFEANASVGLWMQWLILQVLQTTRAATSSGADLDSWIADFSLTRLPAVAAVGYATFSRQAPTLPAFIPAGTQIRTVDGSQTFLVVPNTSHQAFVTDRSGYLLGAGTAAIDVPVEAIAPGYSGNVQANAVTLIVTALPGIDRVGNQEPMWSGLDAETDDDLRARFAYYLDSRSRATPAAVSFAIRSVQQGLDFVVRENMDPDGSVRMGNFIIAVDDGSGMPSDALLSKVRAAVDAVRPVGSTFFVQRPQIVRLDISVRIETAEGANRNVTEGRVGAALRDHAGGLKIGSPLLLTRIAKVAYEASSDVTNVTSVRLNGAADDFVPAWSGIVRPGQVSVS